MNNNWLKYVIGIALIINVLTLGFWFFNKRKPPPPPQQVLIDALKLDDAQRQKFDVLRNQDRATRDSFSKEMSRYRRALYSNFTTKNAAQIDSSTAQIARVFQEMEKSNYQHFADIRALCHPDQQAQFDALILEIVGLFDKKRPKPL